MHRIAKTLSFFRSRKEKSPKLTEKESGTSMELEVMRSYDDMSLRMTERKTEVIGNSPMSQNKIKSLDQEEYLAGFSKKLIQVIKNKRFFYFIRYDKNSKSIIIPSKKDFTAYVLNAQDGPIFKAASFSAFNRQMRLRGFEVAKGLVKKSPGRPDGGVGHKVSNSIFIKAVKTND